MLAQRCFLPYFSTRAVLSSQTFISQPLLTLLLASLFAFFTVTFTLTANASETDKYQSNNSLNGNAKKSGDNQLHVDVSGSFRVRYESLHNPIFPTTREQREQNNERISTRVILNTHVSYNNVSATLDLRDSRAFLDDNDPTLKANQVNTLEPVQLFVSYTPTSSSYINAVKVGRMELDYGSRRLLAKTIYRNATNSYDGIVVDATFSNWNISGLYIQPVSRFPNDAESIDSNERAFDKSFSERRMFGAYITSPDNNLKLQSYWLKEDDGQELATTNRDLYTLSIDYTKAFENGWKGNVELVGQTGTARETNAVNDSLDKDVRAYMLFGYLGKKVSANTFVRAEFDYISGDNNASDDTIENFDSLFGVRRFDFGPTDVYQAMPRRNLKTVGLRSISKPSSAHHVLLGYKALWYQKAPVNVDDFIGHQIEARWRYNVQPNLRLAIGGAYLFKGQGFERGDYSDNSAFLFTGAMYSF